MKTVIKIMFLVNKIFFKPFTGTIFSVNKVTKVTKIGVSG